jgi:hypothetical protein
MYKLILPQEKAREGCESINQSINRLRNRGTIASSRCRDCSYQCMIVSVASGARASGVRPCTTVRNHAVTECQARSSGDHRAPQRWLDDSERGLIKCTVVPWPNALYGSLRARRAGHVQSRATGGIDH